MIDYYLLYSPAEKLYLEKLCDFQKNTPEKWTPNNTSALKFRTKIEADYRVNMLATNYKCFVIPVVKIRNFRVKTEMIQGGTFERQEIISGKSDIEILNKVFKDLSIVGDIITVKIEAYEKVIGT